MKKAVLLVLGVFSLAFPAFAREQESSLYVEIVVEECKLYLYGNSTETGLVLIESHPVASFKPGLSEYPLGLGYATKVEFNPNWNPTNKSVEYMNKKLTQAGKKPAYTKGETISPNDPRNAMGKFKITLTHSTPTKGAIYRIHGTNDLNSIGKRASGGCTRMDDRKPGVIGFAKKIGFALEAGQLVPVNIIMKKSPA